MTEARYYEKLSDNRVRCLLCPHTCTIANGKTGICLNRRNNNGSLYSYNYGRVSAIQIDPIEKKPLFHFYPGKEILSFGTFGCNFQCPFCQNSSIARQEVDELYGKKITPAECVQLAIEKNSFAIAYTYNEPFIWFEHMLETAKLAKEKGLKNVMVSNGFYNPEPWNELSEFIDAVNIDLKGNPDYYQRLCKAGQEPVLFSIKSAFEKNIHVEVTHLVVTDENDSPKEFSKIVDLIAEISPQIPLHISRYFPSYKMEHSPTQVEHLEKYYAAAQNKLEYVYMGNVWNEGENTFCPQCKKVLIDREGYQTHQKNDFQNGQCPNCGHKIYGFFI